jgi:hypothetical protein
MNDPDAIKDRKAHIIERSVLHSVIRAAGPGRDLLGGETSSAARFRTREFRR